MGQDRETRAISSDESGPAEPRSRAHVAALLGRAQAADKRSVVITPYRDGPLLVRGPVRLARPDGTVIECNRDPIALCRCGKSRIRPFCDGTHKLIGFRAP